MNGRLRSRSETEHIRDAEAFELQELISGEDEAEVEILRKKVEDEENPVIGKIA
jgi:hypothetical protein